MTQGKPLFPKIFNVVVDTVIRHWVKVVAPTEEGIEGIGLLIRDLAAYFYSDNGIITLNQPERLQRVVDILSGLFERVGLRKNTPKTVSMACQTCHVNGRMLVEAYTRRTMVTGPTFRDRQRSRVECPEGRF